MNAKTIKRIIASKGGAGIAFGIYSVAIILASLKGASYEALPKLAGFFLVPAAAIIEYIPGTMFHVVGVPAYLVLASLAMYMTVGYTIDWYYEPMR